jgi:hypothetical protein
MKAHKKTSSPCVTSLLVAAFSSFLFTPLLHAGEAHEHGVVTLDAVIEGKLLDVMLMTPAVNIVGFEHLPETEAQKAEILQAISSLKQGYQAIQLPSAALCLLKETDVEQSLLESQHEHDEAESGHADIKVHYQFACAKPEQLTEITVGLFAQFPMIESVRYQVVSQAGQKGGTLFSSQDEILIRE